MELTLRRIPDNPDLQAWDAADEYLLKHLDENRLLYPESMILILNEPFGALSVALADYATTMSGDSFIACQALRNNLALNSIAVDRVGFCDSLTMPRERFDLILIKIPKSLALLEHQLYQLRSLVDRNSMILAAGMSRHIHSSTLALFEKILGPTKTSLAWKKARLIHVQRDFDNNEGQSPYPQEFVVDAGREFRITNHANVFSRDRLDAGSRLLLENMPANEKYRDIIDLGCGNGILGLVAAHINPQASLCFVDESYMAIESSRLNFRSAFGDTRTADFKVNDCLDGFTAESTDLVLNNPPFHQQQHVGDALAWRMFVDSRRVLRQGGELYVVGNRHLAYHAKLKKIFGNCRRVSSNGKFVLLQATRR